MRALLLASALPLLLGTCPAAAKEVKDMTHTELIREIIRTTQPLETPRGDREPLYLWPMHHLGTDDETEAVELMKQLAERGIAVLAHWPGHLKSEGDQKALDRALWLGKLQKRLGQPIGVSATSCTYSFCNGDTATAHVDAEGKVYRLIGSKFFEQHPEYLIGRDGVKGWPEYL